MSAIFGITNFDGKPVTAELLNQMKEPMKYWGPDGGDIWYEQNIGLGQLHLFNTPESVYEKLPVISDDGNLVLTAAARIDNREELVDQLRLDRSCLTTKPESYFILKAYQKWGSDSPKHLFGDWSFAVWDRKEKKLFLARDHHGNTSLYWHRNEKYFAFSSCKKGLLSLNIHLSINELFIAKILVSWMPSGEETGYNEILRLPPAHYITINSNGNFFKQRYWFLENVPDIRFPKESDYYKTFLDIFSKAVKYRLRSIKPIGIMLSSGLDSSSVAAMASKYLKVENKRLYAFTSVPLYETKNQNSKNHIANEYPLTKITADFLGNIDLFPVDAAHISPLDGIKKMLWLLDEPFHAASNAYWLNAILEKAKEMNIGTILTGQGGNATISWTITSYYKKISDFSTILKYITEADFNKIFSLIIPLSLINFYKFVKRGYFPYLKNSFINPEFTKQLKIKEKMQEMGYDPWFRIVKNQKKIRYNMLKPGSSIGGDIWNNIGAGYYLNICDPTNDIKLMTYCFGIPISVYSDNKQNRKLVRNSLINYLPSDIINNPYRGRQSYDIVQRMLKSKDEIIYLSSEICNSTLMNKYFNTPKLSLIKNNIILFKNNKYFINVLKSILIGLFIKNFQPGR
ncbi:MAG: asparagine synthetase B [Bacteroidia bacterium]|nr:asparagine synthetase B [Bacteroidia bacterium]